MRVLVTGGCGFIGSNLCRRLVGNGHEVLNLDLLTYAADPRSTGDLGASTDYRFVKGDIGDTELVTKLLHEQRSEAVLHLAAESHVDRSIDGPRAFLETNILGTYSLLQAIRAWLATSLPETRKDFRLIHVSTDEVFGDLGPEDACFTEETAYRPSSPYSASKAASDHLVRSWQRTYGVPAIITNCSNNYGPNQFPEKLIPLMILTAISGGALPVYGDGLNVRDWLYVEDHAEALEAVLLSGIPGESYNIGGGSERRNIDVVRAICDELDCQYPKPDGSYRDQIAFVKDRPGHDRRYAIDGSKLAAELNWRPTMGFEDGLAATIRWYLENEDWWRPHFNGMTA